MLSREKTAGSRGVCVLLALAVFASASANSPAEAGDGSIVAWGWNQYGQTDVSAGGLHTLGLKADGSMVTWGLNDDGQCDVPAPNTDIVAVAAGHSHSLGLKTDGSIVGWGWDEFANAPSLRRTRT